ncbi:MAG: NosD domain-containing protein [Candidatus Heimdallarchaeaceae archaeon]
MHIGISRQTKIAFITIFLLLSTTLFMKNVGSSLEISSPPANHINYTTSDPLYITNDSDLAGNATSGDGSANTPYVIEGLSIITGDSSAIYITGTTVNFTIRDCYLVGLNMAIWIEIAQSNSVEINNNIVSGNSRGIRVDYTDYTNITDNICQNSGEGIYLQVSDYAYLENNTCFGGVHGIYTWTSTHCTFVDNILYSNSEHGLYLDSSNSCNITENKCYSNTREGIYLTFSQLNSITYNEAYLNNYNGIYVNQGNSNTIKNNYLHNNNRDGIKISYTVSDTVANNTLYDNDWYGINNLYASSTSILDNNATKDGFGIFAGSQSAYDGLTVGGNTVNGKPLGYINGLGEATLAPNVYGQLILVFCNGTIVKDYTIEETSIALAMVGCENVTVDNCNFNNNNYGSIRLDNSMETTIQNTKCSYNEEYGGVYSFGAINTTLYNVTANHNQFGIYLSGATVFNISYSTITSNSWYNTRFQGCVAGNIRYNVITDSLDEGMLLYSCDYTNISHNNFEDNLGYAIYSDSGSMFNWIHHNAFINNNQGDTQAYEDSLLNMWDDPWNLEGNYWDDWVSGNYTLDGIAAANDSYPLGDIPPGVIISEFNQFSLLIFLLPVAFVSMAIIRKRKR